MDLPKKFNPEVMSSVNLWQLYPEVFAREAMGWDGTALVSITPQQMELFQAVGRMARAKLKYKDVCEGLAPKSSLTKDDWYYIKKIGISVMSGKGTGKGGVLALLIAWFLWSFDRCKSPITGPSYEHIRKGLMAEIHKWVRYKNPRTGLPISRIADAFEIQRDVLYLKDEGNQSRFFAVRTAPANANESQQRGTLDGWHEDAMMVVADEAASIPDGVFTSFTTTLTRPFNFAVLVFNPTKASGFAYETHHGPRAESWIQLHWDSRESPLVTPAQLETMERDYGREGPEYRINVLGLPPTDDPSSLISRSWIQAAVDRWNASSASVWENYPVIAGFDPAREGRDESAYVVRQGKRVIRSVGVRLTKSDELGDWALQQMAADEVDVMFIDSVGIGGPMMDYMKRSMSNPQKLRAADVTREATSGRFYRLRDEKWWKLREEFERGLIQIPNDRILINELGSVRQAPVNAKNQTCVETKKQMCNRGMPSPNRADALMMTLFANDVALQAAGRAKDADDDEYGDPEDTFSGASWMGR